MTADVPKTSTLGRRSFIGLGAVGVAAVIADPAPALAETGFAHPPGPGQRSLPVTALAAPTFSVLGGRYQRPQLVRLDAPTGAEIHYTLDGSTPTADSPRYRQRPIRVAESANLTAVAVRDGEVSTPEIEGYLIKRGQPLFSFVVMSDIETPTAGEADRARWDSYFDTITSIQSSPDLILSNGDQINDNNYNTGANHASVRTLLSEGLASHGLDDTQVLMSFGNHDDRLEVMTQYYPKEWFPHDGGGYYEQVIQDHHVLVLNTEEYGPEQRAWLQGRLSALSAEPGGLNRPIFVAGHRPTPGTVNDGAQASNPALTQDLSTHPQVIYVSGHSHLNLNSERSIHQDQFTSVNDGSMSYTQIPRDAYQIYPGHLVDNFTLPIPQATFFEVYADRTEIDRITFASEGRRTYTNGVWDRFPHAIPSPAAGALAGPTWTIRHDAESVDEFRAGFAYTDERAAVSEAPTAPGTLSVHDGPTGSVLRVPQATDDEVVYGYDVKVTDVGTGAVALPLRNGTLVSADLFFAPRPAFLDIPLSIQQGLTPTSPTIGLTPGRGYRATVIAVDVWGHRSTPVSVEFVASS